MLYGGTVKSRTPVRTQSHVQHHSPQPRVTCSKNANGRASGKGDAGLPVTFKDAPDRPGAHICNTRERRGMHTRVCACACACACVCVHTYRCAVRVVYGTKHTRQGCTWVAGTQCIQPPCIQSQRGPPWACRRVGEQQQDVVHTRADAVQRIRLLHQCGPVSGKALLHLQTLACMQGNYSAAQCGAVHTHTHTHAHTRAGTHTGTHTSTHTSISGQARRSTLRVPRHLPARFGIATDL